MATLTPFFSFFFNLKFSFNNINEIISNGIDENDNEKSQNSLVCSYIDPVTSGYMCESHLFPAHGALLTKVGAQLLGVWDPHLEVLDSQIQGHT